ncbi:MAG: hypothetical protein ACPLKP_00970 [Microgenomates group bacterium]
MFSPETKETPPSKTLTLAYQNTSLNIKIETKKSTPEQEKKPKLPQVKDVVIFPLPSKRDLSPKVGLVVVNQVDDPYFFGWLFEISLPSGQSFENFIAEIRKFPTTSLELTNSYESGTLNIRNLPDLIILGQFAGVDDKKKLEEIIKRTKLEGLPKELSEKIMEKILGSYFS